VIAGRPPCGHGRVAGEKERAEEGDDRRGQDVSERERARAGAAGLARWAVRVAGPHGRACGRERADGPRGWAEPKREGGVGPR
jgi:hypothetical protein